MSFADGIITTLGNRDNAVVSSSPDIRSINRLDRTDKIRTYGQSMNEIELFLKF